MALIDIRIPPRDWKAVNPSTLRTLAANGSKPAQEELARRKAVVAKQHPRPKHKTDWGDPPDNE